MTTSAIIGPKRTECESCGETFLSATMLHLDTSPECGKCWNERHADLIARKWAGAKEESYDCDHGNVTHDDEGYWCIDCDTDITPEDDADLAYDTAKDDGRL